MSSKIASQTLVVAGLPVHVYTHAAAADSHLPVAIFFLLHGRKSNATKMTPIAESLLEQVYASPGPSKKDLVIVTFDQRNHGKRLVHSKANDTWKHGGNDQHGLDMYCTQTGTAQDVSFLIDFLPPYLYPSDERAIDHWGIIGTSLGGHSTWIALSKDPRIKTGIPIIGCPDYTKLISRRARYSGIPWEPPYIPKALVILIQRDDPSNTDYASLEPSNPFLGKKILVLSGEKDPIVPWEASREFVERLNVGPHGVKKVIVEANVEHECTKGMIKEASEFLKQEVLM